MERVNRARFRLKAKTNMDPKRIGFHSHPDLNSEAGTSALSQISPRTPSVTHPSVKTPRKKWVIDDPLLPWRFYRGVGNTWSSGADLGQGRGPSFRIEIRMAMESNSLWIHVGLRLQSESSPVDPFHAARCLTSDAC